MPEKYLVIGGNGFLGRHVIEQIRLRKDGSSIAVFDMVKPADGAADVKFYTGDLRKFDDVVAALDGITAVIHTASPPHVNSSNPPRDLYFSINVDGTKNVIEACKAKGITKLVVTSSGSVISTGEPMVNVDESTPYPAEAIDVYTESKVWHMVKLYPMFIFILKRLYINELIHINYPDRMWKSCIGC